MAVATPARAKPSTTYQMVNGVAKIVPQTRAGLGRALIPSHASTQQLAEFANEQFRAQDLEMDAFRTMPDSQKTVVLGVSFSSGVTQFIQHRLQRPWVWVMLGAHYGTAAGNWRATHLTAAQDASAVQITPANSGTFDVLIW